MSLSSVGPSVSSLPGLTRPLPFGTSIRPRGITTLVQDPADDGIGAGFGVSRRGTDTVTDRGRGIAIAFPGVVRPNLLLLVGPARVGTLDDLVGLLKGLRADQQGSVFQSGRPVTPERT